VTPQPHADPKILSRIAELERELSELRRSAGTTDSNGGGSAEWRLRLMESLVNNTQNVIYVKDLAGRFILVNDKFCQIFGLPRESIIGKLPHEVYSPNISANHHRGRPCLLRSTSTWQTAGTNTFP